MTTVELVERVWYDRRAVPRGVADSLGATLEESRRRDDLGRVAWLVSVALRDGGCLVFEVAFGAYLKICRSAWLACFLL